MVTRGPRRPGPGGWGHDDRVWGSASRRSSVPAWTFWPCASPRPPGTGGCDEAGNLHQVFGVVGRWMPARSTASSQASSLSWRSARQASQARVPPEDRAQGLGDRLHQPVVAHDVRDLVREHRSQPGLAPAQGVVPGSTPAGSPQPQVASSKGMRNGEQLHRARAQSGLAPGPVRTRPTPALALDDGNAASGRETAHPDGGDHQPAERDRGTGAPGGEGEAGVIDPSQPSAAPAPSKRSHHHERRPDWPRTPITAATCALGRRGRPATAVSTGSPGSQAARESDERQRRRGRRPARHAARPASGGAARARRAESGQPAPARRGTGGATSGLIGLLLGGAADQRLEPIQLLARTRAPLLPRSAATDLGARALEALDQVLQRRAPRRRRDHRRPVDEAHAIDLVADAALAFEDPQLGPHRRGAGRADSSAMISPAVARPRR